MTLTPQQRRERDRLEIQTRILDAARELLAEEGMVGFSMRKLAARIGYTAAAIYTHFPDRERLLTALCDHDFQRFRRSFDRLEKIADPLERLARMGRGLVEFGLRHPSHYRIMFMTPLPEPHEIPPEIWAQRGNPSQDAYALLRATVAECMAAGLFRPEHTDPELITQAIFSALHGVVSCYLTHRKDPWVDWRPVRMRGRTVGLALMRGLLARPELLDSIDGKVAADGPPCTEEPRLEASTESRPEARSEPRYGASVSSSEALPPLGTPPANSPADTSKSR